MADHLRAQLRSAIRAALAGLPTSGARVFAGRTWPVEDKDYPGILIWTRGGASRFDNQAERDQDRALERDERVVVEAIARTRGVDPDDLLDGMAAEIEPVMMTSTAIAALVEWRELIGTESTTRTQGDHREGSLRLTYRMVFRTLAGDATTKV